MAERVLAHAAREALRSSGGGGAADASLLAPVPSSWQDVDYDVIVVGAGPTGLACANSVVMNGARCLVVEARPGISEKDSKCTGIRPRSVEILAHCGALAALGGAAALQPVADLPVYACRADGGAVELLYSLRGSAAREGVFGAPPHRPCVAYSAEQWRVESALESVLRCRGGAVRRATRLLSFDAQPDGVTVTLAPVAAAAAAAAASGAEAGWEVVESSATAADTTTLRCKYLVGADGVGSAIRTALGVGRDGAPYEELFLIADVRLAGFAYDRHSRPTFVHGEAPADAAARFCTRDVHAAPLGGDKFRLFFVVDSQAQRADLVAAFRQLYAGPTAGAGADAAGVAATVAWMEDALRGYGLQWRVLECLRISRYGVWLGCAAAARGEGPGGRRVFLAGDAAHSHSPHGGQGANAGLQDGWNLGWKLAACSNDAAGATEALLASYGAERAPVWRGVVRMADALKRLSGEAANSGGAGAAARAVWRLLPDATQRRLLLDRLAHKAFAYAAPLGAEDTAVAEEPAALGDTLLPPRGAAGRPGAQPRNAWVVALPAGGGSGGGVQQLPLYDALWGADCGGGFVLLLFAAGVSARDAGVQWAAAARRAAAAVLLVALAWGCVGRSCGAAALAAWAAAAVPLAMRGPATRALPRAPRWDDYAALAKRAAAVPGLAGLRTAVVLPEGAPLPHGGPPPGLRALIDVEGAAAAACGCRGGEAMLLLRPDGHVALRAARVGWQPLADYLPRLFTRLGGS